MRALIRQHHLADQLMGAWPRDRGAHEDALPSIGDEQQHVVPLRAVNRVARRLAEVETRHGHLDA